MHGNRRKPYLFLMMIACRISKLKWLPLAAVMLGACDAFAQQVMNGSFESLSALPSTTGQWSLASGWVSTGSADNTPDVFHIEGVGGGDLPETPVAIVSPFQGMAIAGFTACGMPGTERREYITGSFSSPLQPGVEYQMTFHMTNGDRTPFSQAGLGIGGLGMHFSMGPLQQVGSAPLNETPHFELTPVFYNRDWETIAFTFVAQSAWTYFTWGAFGEDAGHSIQINDGTNPSMAYYFVDAFSIVPAEEGIASDEDVEKGPTSKPNTISLEEEPSWFVPNAFTPNGDGENDVFVPVWNNVEMKRFEVFSRWGERVYELAEGSAEGWNGKTTKGQDAAPGTYIWQVDLVDTNGKTISKSGAITLIR